MSGSGILIVKARPPKKMGIERRGTENGLVECSRRSIFHVRTEYESLYNNRCVD